jgi:O-antigen/teichoic acid export membrane protein
MLKFEKQQILRNVGSSWSALAVSVVVGIFLSPFILHRLGDTSFGIWILIFSVTGYYGLFDLGIRSSIIRYVSKYSATGDQENLTKFVNTALFTYTAIGAASMAVTLLLSSSLEHLFKIPAGMHVQAKILLLIVGASVSLSFPLGVFGGVLEGLQRFYLLNWTGIGATLARAALIVYFLNRGYGLLTVALITVSLPMVSSILRGVFVFRLLPLPISPAYIDRGSFRHMAIYGTTTLFVMIAARLRFRTDELVIGTMMSAAAVTYFNIGARIVDYAQEFVASLAQIFVPMSSQSEARGDLSRVRKIYIAGNRVCALLIIPITTILIFFGKHIIRIWVGARYVPQSYPVLVVMIIPFALMSSQAASGRILFGLGKHQSWAGDAHRRYRQRRSEHCPCPLSWNCRGCTWNGDPANGYLSDFPASPHEEAHRRIGGVILEGNLHATSIVEPPFGGSRMAGQPNIFSASVDSVGAGDGHRERRLWSRSALGTS